MREKRGSASQVRKCTWWPFCRRRAARKGSELGCSLQEVRIKARPGDRFTYEPPRLRRLPCLLDCINRYAFWGFIALVFIGTAAFLTWQYLVMPPERRREDFGLICKICSVPLVCLLFTWFHVWLALVMLFYPIDFWGCPGRPIVPNWLGLPINGWQGIVPRKAGVMARRACDSMIGNIVTVEEFVDRLKPEDLVESLSESLREISSETLSRLVASRCPELWAKLPRQLQDNIGIKVFDEVKLGMSGGIAEVKTSINELLDIKEMYVETMVNDVQMMVDIFRTNAEKELIFIQHLAAFLGFLLGLVQTAIYLSLRDVKHMDFLVLPLSGLIIGYFTNWLALLLTFWPVWPHICCGGFVNMQGIFLQRQREASAKMAELTCSKNVNAERMLAYMLRSNPQGAARLQGIYKAHVGACFDRSLGSFRAMLPALELLSGHRLEDWTTDAVKISLELLPEHKEPIQVFIDKAFDVEATLRERLARVPPPEFESMVHPIFKDDEWVLLVVGGLLGIIIGLLQAWAMDSF